jgi:predicted ATPase
VSLVGRAIECGTLEQWLVAVLASRAGLGLVEGEAGIGKTRLAGAVCEMAAELSFSVFAAGADELDSARPFGVLGNALGVDPWAPAGVAAVPGLEYRLVDQLVERVEESALQRPVAVVLEDLHWADPATVVALRALGRRLAHLPTPCWAHFGPRRGPWSSNG